MIPDGAAEVGRERQLRRACDDLAGRLMAGEDCRAEEFLPDAFSLTPAEVEAALELIYTEYVVRGEVGRCPPSADWYDRFPQWRERLGRLFRLGELLDDAGDFLTEDDLNEPDTPTGGRTPDRPLPGAETPTADLHGGADTLPVRRWQDEYELIGEIGRGGMGVAFKARQAGLDRLVVIKTLRTGAHATPAERARFQDEARKMARLHHPHIVPVYAVGERDGVPFFSMEFAEGGSLAAAVGSRQQAAGSREEQRKATKLVADLAGAVHYAHGKGIIHRDLKPGNVVLTADGTAKVTDFGLAKCLEAEEGINGGTPTAHGVPQGTAGYMAPEQAAGDVTAIGPRTDVYALGAILYELLTGRPPFPTEPFLFSVERILKVEPTRPRALNRRVDAELESVCLKCLEKRPKDRYESAQALAEDLGRWLRGERTKARPRRWHVRVGRAVRRHWVVSAAVALIVLGVGTALTTAYFRDPQRQVEYIQRELQKGHEVTLIGDTGTPRWFRWLARNGPVETSIGADGTFVVRASDYGLLELLPDPKCERYRLRAEVLRDKIATLTPIGVVGIFFGHGQYATKKRGIWRYFCALDFNDSAPKKLKDDQSQFTPPAPFQKGFLAELNLRRIPEPFDGRQGTQRAGVQHFFQPTNASPLRAETEWHEMAVEFSPETVKAFWDGQFIGELHRAEIWERRKFVNFHLGVRPAYSPRGTLGLFVYQGAASFRNVRVEPIGGGN